VWRTTALPPTLGESEAISIHVLRAEDDQLFGLALYGGELFQSTSSVRRTTGHMAPQLGALEISIHVLRAEDDLK